VNNQTDIIAAQSVRHEPEEFQSRLIRNIRSELLKEATSPCLLRAPTGAGKTFVITQILEQVTSESPTMWLWFVPFVNLVQQTEDAIAGNTTALSPVSLQRGRNQAPAAGMVIISTAAAIARASNRASGYTDGEDDTTRSLAAQVELARSRGLKIGLVVDEAHIGLDSQTEFGKFVQWLAPERLIMATATPKDARLFDFIKTSGFSDYESFVASRDDVVLARLNKRYIKAVVYDLRQSMQTIADLQQTVLRQAWRRSQAIKRMLQGLGIPVVPLLLVQVSNGATAVADARQQLMDLCGVSPERIGEHSSDDPDPVLMASIASDSTKEVLIFKQSAGTGFDAPRAFVLASLKPVNDPDFAAQFIGRIMRVHRDIRSHFPREASVEPALDTAYVYLANAQAQQGFEQAVHATVNLKSQLEGQTEKLVPRRTASGAVVYTNSIGHERTLPFGTPLPEGSASRQITPALPAYTLGSTGSLPGMGASDGESYGGTDELDEVEPAPRAKPSPSPAARPRTSSVLVESLQEMGLRTYRLRPGLTRLPAALQTEQRPEMADMSAASRMAATRLEIAPSVQTLAVETALGRVVETEVQTELVSLERQEANVFVVVSRTVLAREAHKVLLSLPQVEEEDAQIIVDILMRRLSEHVRAALPLSGEEPPSDADIKRGARDAAFLVIRRQHESLAELLHEEISNQASMRAAAPLPHAMVFAQELMLERSSKNIYGVMPPSKEVVARLSEVLTIDERNFLAEQSYELDDGPLRLAPFDGAHVLGVEELIFAKALDKSRAVHWWHRNPDRKGYSVRLVRGEHKHYFYPDFLICLEHFPGDEPLQRLIETKESVKDAARKARHASPLYGRVLFLTKDLSKWRWVNENGTLGNEIDMEDLSAMQDWLRQTIPKRAT